MTEPPPIDRRSVTRHRVEELSIDYNDGETFLFSYIDDISEMGIFIRSCDPFPIGTRLALRFGDNALQLEGEVVWINQIRIGSDNRNPGMGVRFCDLDATKREAVVEMVRTVAYLGTQQTN
jgi:type IV pilus assembly protein PilZ